jgi:hypothetical protein
MKDTYNNYLYTKTLTKTQYIKKGAESAPFIYCLFFKLAAIRNLNAFSLIKPPASF